MNRTESVLRHLLIAHTHAADGVDSILNANADYLRSDLHRTLNKVDLSIRRLKSALSRLNQVRDIIVDEIDNPDE